MKGCDLLIAFGSTLSAHTLSYGKVYMNAEIVQIDIDPAALGDTYKRPIQ